MDRETRNGIQRGTQDARALLEREYAEQLEGTFDIRLDGAIARVPGDHLDTHQRLIWSKLVAAVEHLRRGGLSGKEAPRAYLREASFTTLNRFVALKMLEARGLVQECLSRGEESSGFKEFSGLTRGLVQLADHGYRLYIECLFDEIGREVRVLFDRGDPASLLWPRRRALADLLAILNADELSEVWAEDETIGWVYQYFNSDEERRQMRAESAAPRNSRELAVRNQFFTPRYVVQFLADNTLGRIWYEMRQGETRLRDLEYHVRQPTEVFLEEGEEPPPEAECDVEDLSHEGLLRRSIYVPFRRKKDPRDIRVLDPACGSGHFLLYGFDLLLTIYSEAWADRAAPPSEVTGRSLRADYPKIESLWAAVPGLILRHNLHGIDIDARCAQIAALALWMRAQRAFTDFGFQRADRPPIEKTNVVVAEPMPALDSEAAKRVTERLDPVLARLLERVIGHLELAGDLGPLLRVEEAIREEVRLHLGQRGGLFRASDEERWAAAERRVLEALHSSAEGSAGYVHRLFAHDAVRGFGFIDLCLSRYDVVLTNPPFGEPPDPGREVLQDGYGDCRHDIDAAFVRRAQELSADGGAVGAIINRTQFFKGVLDGWRHSCLFDTWRLGCCADLGWGVLDGATVEAACYVTFNRPAETFAVVRALDASDKQAAISQGVSAYRSAGAYRRLFVAPHSEMAVMHASRLAYWATPSVRRAIRRFRSLDPSFADARQGLITADNTRFLRLRWEVSPDDIETRKDRVIRRRSAWVPYAKGGDYSPYFGDVHLVVQWGLDGKEIKALVDKKGRQASRPQNQSYYFAGGITYTERTASGFSPRAIPPGCMFDCKGPIVAPTEAGDVGWLLGVLMSRPVASMLELAVGAGDTSVASGAARQYTQSIVGGAPIPDLSSSTRAVVEKNVEAVWRNLARLDAKRDTSAFHGSFPASSTQSLSEEEYSRWALLLEVLEATWEIEQLVAESYVLDVDAERAISEEFGPHACSLPKRDLSSQEVARLRSLWALPVERVADLVRETAGAKRFVMKSQFFANKKLELVSQLLNCHPRVVLNVCKNRGLVDEAMTRSIARDRLFDFVRRRFRIGEGGVGHSVPTGPWERFPRPPHESGAVGMLVDDQGHKEDLLARVDDTSLTLLLRPAGSSARTLRAWIRKELFSWTIDRYSKSRRKAPVYWQLATPSGSYSVWLYYHRLTRDTLYRVLNDLVTPKLQHEERKLTVFTQEAAPNPSASQRKEIDTQEGLVAELRAFRDEVARVAPLWRPDPDDGVIINFAPLWRLVRQNRSWQKECKKVWDKLESGDYDWAQLSMHLWPERVIPKCAEDRSIAVAHSLEGTFWEQSGDGRWKARRLSRAVVDRLVEERMSGAVKAALEDLRRAPTPSKLSRGRRVAGRSRRSSKSAAIASRPRGHDRGSAVLSVEGGMLQAVKRAIEAAADGASKSAVLEATGISDAAWTVAVRALLEQGAIIKTGAARGTRYYPTGKGGRA